MILVDQVCTVGVGQTSAFLTFLVVLVYPVHLLFNLLRKLVELVSQVRLEHLLFSAVID